jgi:hypothetical protein
MIGLLLQTTRLFVQSAPPIAAARVALVSIASASMWFVLAQKCKSVPLSLAENFGFSNYSFFLFSCALSQWMVVLFPEIFLFRCCRRRFTRCRGSDLSSKTWTACNILGRAYSIVLRSIRFRRLFISQSRLQKSLESHWTSKTARIRMEIWHANYTPNPSPTNTQRCLSFSKPPAAENIQPDHARECSRKENKSQQNI